MCACVQKAFQTGDYVYMLCVEVRRERRRSDVSQFQAWEILQKWSLGIPPFCLDLATLPLEIPGHDYHGSTAPRH